MASVSIIPFSPEHISRMDLTDEQRAVESQKDALGYGDAWTVTVDGHPVACGGVMPIWDGRGYAWALMGRDSGPYMLHITRAVKRGLLIAPFRRVEMAVDATFAAGCRWAQLLGFVRETPEPLRAYLPNGRDAWLYARVT